MKVRFGKERGHAEVDVGSTRVIAQTSCEVTEPHPNRPSEGIVQYNVDVSPMALPSCDPSRPSAAAVETHRVVERCLKESRVVETESLCEDLPACAHLTAKGNEILKKHRL